MPPLIRSTGSSASEAFQSLPNKPARIRSKSSTVTSTKRTRARSESVVDRSDYGYEGNQHETTGQDENELHGPPGSNSIEVHIPLKKHSATERDNSTAVAVSPRTQDHLRRISAGSSIIGASMGESPIQSKKPSAKKSAVTTQKAPSRKKATNAGGETQDPTAPASIQREPGPGSSSALWDPPNSSPVAVPPVKPKTKRSRRVGKNIIDISPETAASAPLGKSTRNGGSHEHVMDGFMRIALGKGNESETVPSSGAPELSDEAAVTSLSYSEGGEEADVVESGGGERDNNNEKRDSDDEDDEGEGDKDDKNKDGDYQVEGSDYEEEDSGGEEDDNGDEEEDSDEEKGDGGDERSEPTSLIENPCYNAPHGEPDQEADENSEDDFTQLLNQIKKSEAKFRAIRKKLSALKSDFDELKTLQLDKENGWYELLRIVSTSVVEDPLTSIEELAAAKRLDNVMKTFYSFEQDTKFFTGILKRALGTNNTQLKNIEKCQGRIRSVFKELNYESKAKKPLSKKEIEDQKKREKELEEARKAMKKRDEEIERALRQREREVFRCRTPDSSDDFARTQKRRRIADRDSDTEDILRQKQIRAVVIEDDEESEDEEENIFHPTSQQHGYSAGEGDDGWPLEEGMGGEDMSMEEPKEIEEDVYGQEEEGYVVEDNSNDGEENNPIIIGAGNDVEVVEIEAFGERHAKARARAEMATQGVDGESDDGVEVLEDREWEDDETQALLNGIEKFNGNHRFDLIKNFYGYGNRAPLRHRSIPAIRERAIEIKKELIEGGNGYLMGRAWNNI